MSRESLAAIMARAFRRTALPLASYYAITLAVPLANGAAHAGEPFAAHALIVLVVPPIAIVLACALWLCVRGLAHQDVYNAREKPKARMTPATLITTSARLNGDRPRMQM